jgi:hypothetical protein
MANDISASTVTCNQLIANKIILNGWTITVSGETILATSPGGVPTKFEMIDFTNILGEQPTTPTDYVSPVITGSGSGFTPQ